MDPETLLTAAPPHFFSRRQPAVYAVTVLELDFGVEFDGTREEDFFSSLPPRPGIFLLEMTDANAEPYLARTADIRRAAERLLRVPETPSKRLNLRDVASRIRYRATGSKFEQTFALYQQARAHFPRRYRDLMRLRPPAFLKVNLRSEYPRCYVTRRIRADEGFYFGPFASRRTADGFSESFLDLFTIRRCQIRIRRDPDFPGCIYSEMKMCLAPCFAGCTKPEYDAEVDRVLETLETTGEALTGKFTREREAASEALDFERAAALHKRLEKVSGVLRGLPEIARRVERLNAVILERAADKNTILAFPVLGGFLAEPIFLRFAEISSEPRSVEAILRSGLGADALTPSICKTSAGQESKPQPDTIGEIDKTDASFSIFSAGGEGSTNVRSSPPVITDRQHYGLQSAPRELTEHLSILARWFYSNPREGEIFFKEGDWPYRRLLRACARLLAPAPKASESRPVPPTQPAK